MHPTDANPAAVARRATPAWHGVAGRAPRLVIAVTGDLHVELPLPADEKVDQKAAVIEGRIEIAPLRTTPGSPGRFTLDYMSLSFADLCIDRPFLGSHTLRMAGMHLRGAVPFAAPETRPGVYAFSLQPQDVNLYAAALDNGRLHAGYERPSQDVTGTIDLNARAFEARLVTLKTAPVHGMDLRAMLTIILTGAIRSSSDSDEAADVASGAHPRSPSA